MGTANAAGFGGSFATGLASALSAGRDRKDAAKRRSESHALEAVKFMLDSGQVQDIGELEPMLALGLPDVFGEEAQKKNKKGAKAGALDGPGVVKHVLSQALLQGRQGQPLMGPGSVQPAAGAVDREAAFAGPIPASGEGADPLPSRAVAAGLPSPVPAPRRTLAGVPLLSPDEVIQRKTDQGIKADEAQINAKVGLARRILPALQSLDPSQTLDDAMMAVGLKTRASLAGSIQKPPQVGTFGDHILRKQRELGRELTTDEVETERSDWTVQRFGQERESAAARLYGKSYSQLTPDERTKADEAARASVEGTSAARTKGAGEGKMDAPLTITQAQTTGGEVGTTSNDVLGQKVATKEQNEIRRAGTQLTGQISNLRTLLSVLPSDKDMIGGRLPGAVLEVRKRDPNFRAKVAALESAVNSMVNNAARVVAGAKGAQSENDAKRAEAAIVALQQNLKGILTGGGDTQESAGARMDETQKAIDAVLKSLPAEIVRKAAAAPAATGSPTGGYTMINGVMHLNGKPVE